MILANVKLINIRKQKQILKKQQRNKTEEREHKSIFNQMKGYKYVKTSLLKFANDSKRVKKPVHQALLKCIETSDTGCHVPPTGLDNNDTILF